MKFYFKFFSYKKLYIHFCILAFLNIFFSTDNIYAKTFLIEDIEISTPFEINFDKNEKYHGKIQEWDKYGNQTLNAIYRNGKYSHSL